MISRAHRKHRSQKPEEKLDAAAKATLGVRKAEIKPPFSK
jgi:hypothetical protein